MMRFPGAAGSAAVMLLAATIASQAGFAQAPPPIAIHQAAGPIIIDGWLDDPGWQGAARIEQFYQVVPCRKDGPAVVQEPKLQTVVLLTYDNHNLYVGLRCNDPDPSKIRKPFVDRDAISSMDDFVAVFLATHGDRRAAAEFRVNPRGQQTDAIVDDGSGNEDLSPDFSYEAKAKIIEGTEGRWQAEMRIPFSSLRYDHRKLAKWGILIWRNYPRDDEDYQFSNVPVRCDSTCLVCNAVELTGLENLPNGGEAIIAPYVTLTEEGEPRGGVVGAPFRNKPVGGNGGLDAKWMPSSSTAVDGTINPDFSQVESDVDQITVNKQFAIFYPEKRPFFLEATDLFNTPIQAIYTRTITSPRWGARATGQVDGSAYTLFVTEDRGGGSVTIPGATASRTASQDFDSFVAIGRVRHCFGTSCATPTDSGPVFFGGLLVTERENSASGGGGHNRVLGPDFLWRSADKIDQVTGQFLYSDTQTPDRPELDTSWDGRKLPSHAAYLQWLHSDRNWLVIAQYQDIGDGFRADDGYVPRVGYRYEMGKVGYSVYEVGQFQRRPLLSKLEVGPLCIYQTLPDGGLLQRQCGVFLQPSGQNNLSGEIDFVPGERDRISNTVVDSHFTVYFKGLSVDPGRVFSRISLSGWAGDNPDVANARPGHGADLDLTGTIKPGDHLSLDFNAERSWLDVSAGGPSQRLFSAQISRLKATYNWNSQTFFRLIGQYSTTTSNPALYVTGAPVPESGRSFNGSALFAYKLTWQTVLFVGYGDSRALDANGALAPASREFFLKASYAYHYRE